MQAAVTSNDRRGSSPTVVWRRPDATRLRRANASRLRMHQHPRPGSPSPPRRGATPRLLRSCPVCGGSHGGLQRDADHRADVRQQRVLGGIDHRVVEVELGGARTRAARPPPPRSAAGERRSRTTAPRSVARRRAVRRRTRWSPGSRTARAGPRRAPCRRTASATTSASSRCHDRRGRTRVPVRGFTSTSPLACNTLIASRTTVRLTPSSAARSSSLGSGAPLGHAPATIRRPRSLDDPAVQTAPRIAEPAHVVPPFSIRSEDTRDDGRWGIESAILMPSPGRRGRCRVGGSRTRRAR